MKRVRTWVLLFAAVLPLSAAIDGTVVNRTTGKPQAGVSITLVKPGQGGMKTLGTTTSDAAGHFVFAQDQPGGGPQLLQANYAGVSYNKLMTPNIPTSGVELDVFETTKSPVVAQVAQNMLIIEPSRGDLTVSQTVLVQNDSNTTFHDPQQGDFLFYLPPAANGQVRINVQGPQGMPLPRPSERTKENGVLKVDFPIKPGQTQFEVSYVLPAGSPFAFRGRVVNVKGMPAGPLRLVAPSGVTLAGDDIQLVGTEPKTQATIYTVTARDLFSVNVTGIGSLRPPETAADESDSPPVTEGKPQIYAHLPWLVALAFTILGTGLLILFRTSPVGSPYRR
ncbi:MAG: carboxypeptidase regulatory-like domain-containing protein [Acidobacteriaceae bacterium]|nr:carboxypeptidase regulatory-like domain-containing protein [Acidobacteriaceae bacterium]